MTGNAQRIQFLISQEDGFTRTRLPALYSDFRGLRSTNPEGYAANVAAWRRGLAALVRGGMLPSTSAPSTSRAALSATATAAATTTTNFLILTAGQQLLDVLQSDRYGRPLALDAVIREAVQERDLIPVPAYFKARESIYLRRSWMSWAALPFQAVSWGLTQLGFIDSTASPAGGRSTPIGAADGRIASEQFVVLANVEAAATMFADKTADLRSRFERTWSVAHFKRQFGQPGAVLGGREAPPRLSDADLDVLLTFLSRDKGLVAYDGKVVTLRPAGDHGSPPVAITDEDRAVAQVRELVESLTHQTGVLSRRIDDLTTTARDAVLRKNRVAALAALRQKKQTEGALTTRFATLAQLEAVAAQLEQASNNVQVVQAMAASADALKSLNAQVGGADRVEDVVDRLRDQMDAADEIGRILAEAGPASSTAVAAGTPGLVIDEGEIDDELAALEQQERERTGAAARAEADAQKEEARVKQEAADRLAAEETRQRLQSAGKVPDTIDSQAAAAEAALEAEATESLRNLSLKEAA